MPDSLIPVDPDEAERFGAFYRRAGGEPEVLPPDDGVLLNAGRQERRRLRAERIRVRGGGMALAAIEIGRDLLDERTECDAEGSNFESWLAREFNWQRSTAYRFMSLADTYPNLGHDIGTDGLLPPMSVLLALASPKVPQEVRDDAIAEASAGKRITLERARGMVEDAKAKAKAAADARAEKAIAEGIEKVRAELQDQIDEVEQRIAKASKQAATEATKAHREKLAELRQTLADLRAKKNAPPDINRLAADAAKLLGVSRLNDEQLQRLAHALGVGFIMKSGKTAKRFEPVSPEESAAAERRMEIAQRITYAIQTLAGAPPGPDMARAAFALHRNVARKELPGIIAWAQEYLAAVGSDREDPRDE